MKPRQGVVVSLTADEDEDGAFTSMAGTFGLHVASPQDVGSAPPGVACANVSSRAGVALTPATSLETTEPPSGAIFYKLSVRGRSVVSVGLSNSNKDAGSVG
jgi:hypothetical protein